MLESPMYILYGTPQLSQPPARVLAAISFRGVATSSKQHPGLWPHLKADFVLWIIEANAWRKSRPEMPTHSIPRRCGISVQEFSNSPTHQFCGMTCPRRVSSCSITLAQCGNAVTAGLLESCWILESCNAAECCPS